MKVPGLRIVLVLACVAGCKKKSVESPQLEILSAEVEGGKQLTVRFALLDDAGKRERRDGQLSISYIPIRTTFDNCSLFGTHVAASEFVDDPGGPVGVAMYDLTDKCVQRPGVRFESSYHWMADERDDGLPVSANTRKVVIPTYFGGTGRPIDERDQEPPPPERAPIKVLDDLGAHLASLAEVVPEPDLEVAPTKCAPDVLAKLRLVDYDVARSFATGTPVVELDVLRRNRKSHDTHPRHALNDDVVWKLALRRWHLIVGNDEQALADQVAALPKHVPIGFVRVKRYIEPKLADLDYNKYVPGLLEAVLFVVDDASREVLCHAPVRATQAGTIEVITTQRGTLSSDMHGKIFGAIADAKLAMGGTPAASDAGP